MTNKKRNASLITYLFFTFSVLLLIYLADKSYSTVSIAIYSLGLMFLGIFIEYCTTRKKKTKYKKQYLPAIGSMWEHYKYKYPIIISRIYEKKGKCYIEAEYTSDGFTLVTTSLFEFFFSEYVIFDATEDKKLKELK